MRIAIIGGGIGGLTTAHALLADGHEVTVHERAEQLSEVGAGITLWCNATSALADLGLADLTESIGYPIGRAQTLTPEGDELVTVDVAGMDSWVGSPSVAVHRHELQQALADQLPNGVLQLGQECVRAGTAGRVASVAFADGRELTVDLVIGADGIHSVVRQAVLPDQDPVRYAGYTCWRGVADHPLPVRSATSRFAAAGGTQCGLLRLTDDRVYWFITGNAAQDTSSPDSRAAALARIDGWESAFREPVEATPADRVLHDDIFDLRPLPRWYRGRLLLLGDAAHATTPNLGQGACQAIEDAPALALVLRDIDVVDDALYRYTEMRKRRAERVIKLSRRFGRMAQLQQPMLVWLRNQMIRSAPGYVQREFERIPTGR